MHTVSLVDESITSLQDLQHIEHSVDFSKVVSLNLHSNEIQLLDNVIFGYFTSLTRLDLSSNLLKSMVGFDGLLQLETLNLANNLIVKVEGLRNLKYLQKLNLSFNNIDDISGFVDLHGDSNSLKIVDLKGNVLTDLDQLRFLAGCTKLVDLTIIGPGKAPKVNPMCVMESYRPWTVFKLIPQIRILNGRDIHGNEANYCQPPVQIPHIQGAPEQEAKQYQPALSRNNVSDIHILQNTVYKPLQNILSKVSKMESQLADSISKPQMATNDIPVDSTLPIPPFKSNQQENIEERLQSLECHISKLTAYPASEQVKHHNSKSVDSSGSEKNHDLLNGERLSAIEEQISKLSETISLSLNSASLKSDYSKTSLPENQKSPDRTNSNLLYQIKVAPGIKTSELDVPVPARNRLVEIHAPVDCNTMEGGNVLTVPMRVPSMQDPKNMSLVWISDGSSKMLPQRDHSANSTSAKNNMQNYASCLENGYSDYGKPSHAKQMKPAQRLFSNSKQVDTLATANSELISALEKEKQRLCDNEQLYIEKIKTLVDQLQQEKAISKLVGPLNGQLKAMKAHIEKHSNESSIREQLLLSQNAINQKLIEETEKLKAQANETNIQLTEKIQEVLALKNTHESIKMQLTFTTLELEQSQKRLHDAETSTAKLNAQIEGYKTDQHKIASKLLKDREQYKIRAAESKKETNVLKQTIEKLSSELGNSIECLSLRESDYQMRIESIQSTHALNINEAVNQTTAQLTHRHQAVVSTLQTSLQQTRQAYQDLEQEFRLAVKEQDTRSAYLQKMLETSKENIEKLEQATILKEKELTDMIRELSGVIKSQQIKALSLEKRAQVAEEKEQELEEILKELHATRVDRDRLLQQISFSEAELKACQTVCDNAQENSRKLADQLKSQSTEHAKQISQIDCFQTSLQEQCTKLKEQTAYLDQAVRVKSKMLDDQNETIRILKQNLENKARDHQSLVTKFEDCQEELAELRHIDAESVADLKAEIQRLEKSREKYQLAAHDYRNDRDEIARALEEMRETLNSRNQSIEMIEQEVGRVKEHFKLKENRVRAEKEKQLQNIQIVAESNTRKLKEYEQERSGMINTIADLRSELDNTNSRCATQESDIKILLSELDSCKRKTNDKISRLKAALNEA
ncbi:hypothetical protein MT418_005913 [Batrachochytrium dendrobatidis]